jgi:hypothetical protein
MVIILSFLLLVVEKIHNNRFLVINRTLTVTKEEMQE